jgi:hypothetical protein
MNHIKQLHCKRCGHTWWPRGTQTPQRCATKNCRSPYWNKPRKAQKPFQVSKEYIEGKGFIKVGFYKTKNGVEMRPLK